MPRFLTRFLSAVGAATVPLLAFAEPQDPPEFEEGYSLPELHIPEPQSMFHAWVDVALLAGALGLAAWLVLKQRSRRGLWLLMVLCLLYFGFYREGCVCPVGSVQNVSEGLLGGATVPLTIVLFFALPLFAALLWGRVFCGAVCPLGAMQDVVLIKNVRVPSWLEHPLSLLAYVYLGLGVLFAATGAGYVICQYDPFVPIFRLGGPFYMIVLSGLFIVLAMFVGRPYCRFLCPYAVLLRLFSRVSKSHLTIYPDSCINCRLCEESCPFEAINPSTGDKTEKVPRQTGKKTFIGAVLALPLLCLALGFLGSRLAGPLSRVHRTVALADMVATDQLARADGGKPRQVPDEVTAFYDAYGRTAEPIHQLGERAQEVYGEFVIGGWFLGIFLGLAAGIKLIGLLLRPRRDQYEADKGACFSCARCFDYCPGAAAGLPETGSDEEEDEGGKHAASSSA